MPFADVIELDPLALGVIIFRTLVVYFALLLGLRLTGKRQLGQMTSLDLVLILVISNAVQNAMVGPDTTLTGGLVAAFALLIINWLIHRAGLKWAWLEQRVVGSATLLINDGQFVVENMRHEGVEPDEVLMALREHGVSEARDVETAVLEVDGSISVIPRGATSQRIRHRFRGRKPVQ